MVDKFLKALGKGVYPYFFPGVQEEIFEGAENYFLDLKKTAPFKVFLTHLILALFIYLSPLLLFQSVRPFPRVSQKTRDKVLTKLKNFPLYSVRLAFFGAKGHAFVAVLRNIKARTYFGLNS